MNLKGLQLLKSRGISIQKDLTFFRELSELPKVLLEKYEQKIMWLAGFDDQMSINHHPYQTKCAHKYRFLGKEFAENFLELNEKMRDLGIPQENRIYSICESWTDSMVEFAGHAYYMGGRIEVDAKEGNRPPKSDWTPDMSLSLAVHNRRPLTFGVEFGKHEDALMDICRTLISLGEGAYIDFTMLKEGRMVYHDLSIHD
jgi:hypothetical protein